MSRHSGSWIAAAFGGVMALLAVIAISELFAIGSPVRSARVEKGKTL